MRYDEHLIEEIRMQNSIIDVISERVHLTPKGSSHFGLCPFHNEKTPSFSANEEKQMYYCFGCGAGGNVFTFIMEYENYSFVEAVKYLAERSHIDLPKEEMTDEMKQKISHKQKLLKANTEAAKYFYYQMVHDAKKKVITYLDERGISEESRKKFGLGYAKFYRDDLQVHLNHQGFKNALLVEAGLILPDKNKKHGYYDRFFNRLMFPIFDVHGRVIAFGGRILTEGQPKYLNSPETKLFNKGRNLYGMHLVRRSRNKKVIVVEGYMDVIALHQVGFDYAVASLGTAFTSGQASLVKRYVDEVILAYDTDEAGIRATLRTIPILKNVGLSVRILSVTGAKDPDEFIKVYGAEAFGELVNQSVSSFMYEIEQLEKSYHLEDPEGRTKFDIKVVEKLLTLESESERTHYLDAVIHHYKMKRSAIESLLAQKGKNIGIVHQVVREEKVQHRDSKDALLRAQKNLLTLVGLSQEIYQVVHEHITPEMFSDLIYKKVAHWLYLAYEENRKIEPAYLVQKFDQIEEQNKVANIFNNVLEVTDSSYFEKMIVEYIQLIKGHYIEDNIKNNTDSRKQQDMIKMKWQLDRLTISLN